jgi:hypothetical protein
MLDLESDTALIERLTAKLRRLEHEIVDVAQHTSDVGHPEVADRLDQLIRMIDAVTYPKSWRAVMRT